jgi:hypothetical protein
MIPLRSRLCDAIEREGRGTWRGPARPWICLSLALWMGLLAGGCGSRSAYEPMKGASYRNPRKDPAHLGRVALVECDNRSSFATVSKDVSDALYVALQKKQQFGLTTVAQTDPAWRSLQVESEAIRSPEQCMKIRQALGCDALLTGVVTEYQPYPHLMIGLRLRLTDLTDGQLVWAVEQVWDSTDRATEARIKKYLKVEMRSSRNTMSDPLMVVSSLNFLRFVAYEVALTL